MLRKIITLSIITAVVLIGVENLIAQEETDKPQTEPGRRQRGRAEQFRERQPDSEAQAKRAEAMGERRQQEVLQKNRQQDSAQKGAPRGRISRGPQQSRPGQNLPMRQVFGKWLNELTEAYRENDRQRMGQLIRRMHQLRQERQNARDAFGPRRQGFWGRTGIAKRWLGADIPPRGIGRRGIGFRLRGMGRWSQGRGMGGWGRGFPGRGMGGWGLQGRGMGRPGPGMPPPPDVARPDPPMPPEDEDVVRPMPPMRRRGMGRRGRDLPETEAVEPEPRGPGRRFE